MLHSILAATAALILSVSAASAQGTAGQADQAPAEAQLNAHQRLSLGQSQLQHATLRLQRAKDTAAGQVPPEQIEEARKIATNALDQVNDALQELQQGRNTDEAQQAIRNARLELQSAQQALQGLQADTPDATIQAFKDLERAAVEVQETTQVAAQPEMRR